MRNKYNKSLTNDERELEILRRAVDLAQEKAGKKIVNSPEVKKMIDIVENFIRKKKLICYGGTAINNLLPEQDQFYNKDVEIPDYDFFSDNALEHAKQLADIYSNLGYSDVEAKSGQHYGTYKVFVDFIPVADITQLEKTLFKTIKADAISVNGIYYAPVNYLRMSMYLELSRPAGDTSRWEKVLKRLLLLNKNYPLKGEKCNAVNFVRSFEGNDAAIEKEKDIYNIVKSTLIHNGVVFFGGYASNLYSKYMPVKERKVMEEFPDFDVLSEEPEKTAAVVKEQLRRNGYRNVKIIKKPGVGENISDHYEITIDGETISFIYKPLACHSYNTINLNGQTVKIATIDTMLSFYLAFLYADRPYYDTDRILCMAEYLFNVQSKNRLEQKGLLRRFSINCYGYQKTKEDMLAEKAKVFEELKNKQNTKEFEQWFLRYIPKNKSKSTKVKKSNKIKTQKSKVYRTKKNKTKKYRSFKLF